MPALSKSIELASPAAEVYALVTDPSRWAEWNTTHAGFPKGEPEALDPGTQFVQKLKIMGMPADVSWTVAEADGESNLTLEGSGPMGAQLKNTYTVSSNGDGTKLSYDVEISGGGVDGPMGPPVIKQADKEAEISLEKFRDLLGG